MSKSSFEERIARLQQNPEHPSHHAPQPPTPEPKGTSRRGILALMALVPFGFVIVGLVVGTLMATQGDKAYITTAAQAAEDEVAGRWSLQRLLMRGDGGADLSLKLAVHQAEQRLKDESLTPEQKRVTAAFIKNNKGSRMTDGVRGAMTSTLTSHARVLGKPDLAQEIEEKMSACESMNCLAFHESQYRLLLNKLEQNSDL